MAEASTAGQHDGPARTVTARAGRVLAVAGAVLLAASAAAMIHGGASMAAMGRPMPGGWTLSMAWMRMDGQTWTDAAAAFLGMWLAMTVAMMLPALAPVLWRYQQAAGSTGEPRPGGLAVLVGAGYFLVWTGSGVAVFAAGAALAASALQQPALARAMPLAAAGVVVLGGAFQFSAWKARALACCRSPSRRERSLPADAGTAWRHGLRLGLHCNACCAGLTAILLATGLMDLRMMAAMTAAITLERFAPDGERVARAIGAIGVLAGLLLLVQAAARG